MLEEKNTKVLSKLNKYTARLDLGAEGKFLEIQIALVDKLPSCQDKSNIITSSIIMVLCANDFNSTHIHTHTHFELLIYEIGSLGIIMYKFA